MTDWSRTLKGGEAPVYLLHGDEPFLSRQGLDWLRGAVLAGAIEDFNLDRFDAKESGFSVARVLDAARTLPMMAARRMVLVRNADILFAKGASKGTAKGVSKQMVESLVSYLAAPEPLSVLVLHAPTRVLKNGRLYKAIGRGGCAAEFQQLREREISGWLQGRARSARGAVLRADAAALMVECVGRELGELDSALERACLFAGQGVEVELPHVEAVVAHTRIRTAWELIDAVGDRRLDRALAHARVLAEQGEPPLRLLGLLARQFRQLVIGRGVRAKGGSVADAAAEAGVPGFRASAFGRQLQRYSGQELIAALQGIARTDRLLKGSRVDDALIVEGLLMSLCGRSPGATAGQPRR